MIAKPSPGRLLASRQCMIAHPVISMYSRPPSDHPPNRVPLWSLGVSKTYDSCGKRSLPLPSSFPPVLPARPQISSVATNDTPNLQNDGLVWLASLFCQIHSTHPRWKNCWDKGVNVSHSHHQMPHPGTKCSTFVCTLKPSQSRVGMDGTRP